jgi:hypothetical protein
VLGASAFSAQAAVRYLGISLGAVGVVVCGIVRDAGRKRQVSLWASWGGSPTIRRLRWRTASRQEAVARLHGQLNRVLDEPLPDAAQEAGDPEGADDRYEEATARLRELTRDTSRFRLVFAENVEYGFRRNSLGLRPFALAIALGGVVLSAAVIVFAGGDLVGRLTRWGPVGLISAVCALFWWRIVTPDWVRRSADLYADRLFDALHTLTS